jgi:cysteine synthase
MSEFAHYFDSVVDTIGHTPVVPLRRLGEGLGATVLVKLESRNPGGSVKDRIGLAMIKDAEERGLLTPGESVIVEPTSGNTGIALALVGAERGYRVILTMPESMSIERRKLLAAYGAELVLTPREKGMRGAVEEAERVAVRDPGRLDRRPVRQPGQSGHPLRDHRTRGACAVGDRTLGAFVAGVGTGGTITGGGRYLKEHRPGALAIAVEPAESPIITQTRAGESITPGPHLIQGIGANFILRSSTSTCSTRSSRSMPTQPSRRRAVWPPKRVCSWASRAERTSRRRFSVASRPELAGTVIVTVAPSTGERYLSTKLWEELG